MNVAFFLLRKWTVYLFIEVAYLGLLKLSRFKRVGVLESPNAKAHRRPDGQGEARGGGCSASAASDGGNKGVRCSALFGCF